jgi:thioredoxin-related protein
MKFSKIIVILTIFLFQFNFDQEKADVELNKALTEAKSKKKNLLLVFNPSW